MEFTILLITIIFVSLIQIFIPFLSKRTVAFGVSIPYKQAAHPKLRQYKQAYTIATTVIALVVLAGFSIWYQKAFMDEAQLAFAGMISPFIVLLAGLALYFYFHIKITKVKSQENWYQDVKQVYYTDLAIRSKDEMIASFTHLIPMVITVGLIILTAIVYNRLPSQIPTHWGPSGQADAFSAKSWISVLGLPVTLLMMQLLFIIINVFTKKSGIKINPGNKKSSKLRQLRLRKYTSWFLLFINILVTMLFALLQLNLIYPDILNGTLMLTLPLVLLVFTLAGTLWLAIKVGGKDSDLEGKLVVDHPDQVEGIDEDQYWKGGLFYYNRNDPSIFVEKRFGIGFTLNFAHPAGYLFIFLIVLLILVPSLLI